VETKEQLSYLLNRRCVEMQGFFLGKPMPAAALADVLRMQH
jgi:EAL domain-containing protein (putative c-di-GMP-specific phosphodiesterase class I)